MSEKVLMPMTDPFRCRVCGLPFARLQNGSLLVESKHHGEKHVNVVSVWDLVLLVLRRVASVEERSTPDESQDGQRMV